MKRILVCLVVIFSVCSGVYAVKIPASKVKTKINPKDGAVMVWVPSGEFIMGSTDKQITTELNNLPVNARSYAKILFYAEKPQRKVYLDGYWIYKYEVTVAQYRKFCKETKRKMPEIPDWGWKDDNPVVNVSWHDAKDYAKWAGVSIPTEAQWEKAARGTDGRIYPWGNTWDNSKCVNGVKKTCTSTQSAKSNLAGASPYGCINMAGNAEEWCLDWYDEYYYKSAPSKNPTGPKHPPDSGLRVMRGGSWNYNNTDDYRCSARTYSDPTGDGDNYGFRCAKTP